jgi:hypothetical protein
MKARSSEKTAIRKTQARTLLQRKQGDLQRDAQLRQLLSELALILLPSGITPMHFAELAKHAFVSAAGEISRFRNGKVNRSRIAVITGLHRSEVKRLLQNSRVRTPVAGSRLARTERVVSGWISDRRYLDRDGKPRKLRISGQNNSFASLVRAFAGDVPHRAVLDELKRSRSVIQTREVLELNTRAAVSTPRVTRSFSKVLPTLVDAISLAAQSQRAGTDVPIHRLTLEATDSAQLAILRERLSSGASSLVSGFKNSLKRKVVSSRKPHSITITAFIRERSSINKPRRSR